VQKRALQAQERKKTVLLGYTGVSTGITGLRSIKEYNRKRESQKPFIGFFLVEGNKKVTEKRKLKADIEGQKLQICPIRSVQWDRY
jgi:hypothetical protein